MLTSAVMFKRILVPVDYSSHSTTALTFAAELARLHGAALDIVHVWDRPTYITDEVLIRHGSSKKPLGELVHENAEKDMKDFLTGVSFPAAVPHEARLISGDPATALLKELEGGRHDLVVVGTHGRSGLAHLMLGSVAEKLVRHAPVPVLTVPKPSR